MQNRQSGKLRISTEQIQSASPKLISQITTAIPTSTAKHQRTSTNFSLYGSQKITKDENMAKTSSSTLRGAVIRLRSVNFEQKISAEKRSQVQPAPSYYAINKKSGTLKLDKTKIYSEIELVKDKQQEFYEQNTALQIKAIIKGEYNKEMEENKLSNAQKRLRKRRRLGTPTEEEVIAMTDFPKMGGNSRVLKKQSSQLDENSKEVKAKKLLFNEFYKVKRRREKVSAQLKQYFMRTGIEREKEVRDRHKDEALFKETQTNLQQWCCPLDRKKIYYGLASPAAVTNSKQILPRGNNSPIIFSSSSLSPREEVNQNNSQQKLQSRSKSPFQKRRYQRLDESFQYQESPFQMPSAMSLHDSAAAQARGTVVGSRIRAAYGGGDLSISSSGKKKVISQKHFAIASKLIQNCHSQNNDICQIMDDLYEGQEQTEKVIQKMNRSFNHLEVCWSNLK